MRNIKLTIEYDGKRYSGWQRLGNSEKTIQGKIESILKQMTGEPIEIIGSGRTDAGTHALGQVANFKTTSSLTTTEMLSFLNRYLPGDIVVKEVTEMPERFHARYNATGKQYSYRGEWSAPSAQRSWFLPGRSYRLRFHGLHHQAPLHRVLHAAQPVHFQHVRKAYQKRKVASDSW